MDDELGFVVQDGSDLIHVLIEDIGVSLDVTMCGNGKPRGDWYPANLAGLMKPTDFCMDCIAAWGRYAQKRGGR